METPSLSLKDTGRIYLDHNATTAPLRSIVEQLPEWSKSWGNPSSIHFNGRSPKNLMREARQILAEWLGVHPLELVFTSGGSESNTAIIEGVYAKFKSSPRQEYVLSAVEHPSVVASFRRLEGWGAKVHVVPVNKKGEINLDFLQNVLSEKTALVSVMFANNETGTIFPIKEITKLAHEHGALMHTDAVQSLGKVAVNLKDWGVDFATFSAHKMYALKGSGLIFAKRGVQWDPLILGGGQERGRRAGTENVLAIAAFGHAAREMKASDTRYDFMRVLRDQMEQKILAAISDVQVNAADSPRIPNTSSLLVSGLDGETLLMNLDIEGVSVSTGAACSSGNPEPSPVLLAMGFTRFEAQTSLRLSLGWDTTEEEVHIFVEKLKKIVERLRKIHSESLAEEKNRHA